MLFFIGCCISGTIIIGLLLGILSIPFGNGSVEVYATFAKIGILIVCIFTFSGAIVGFYLSYSGKLQRKKIEQDTDDNGQLRVLSSAVFPMIALLIVGIIGYIVYVNMRAYNRYGYYVHVTDEKLFDSKMDPLNPKIVHHGLLLEERIHQLDERIDGGDGKKEGKVRWIECYGNDCDEGWDNRSYK